jgi:hypothetical protein
MGKALSIPHATRSCPANRWFLGTPATHRSPQYSGPPMNFKNPSYSARTPRHVDLWLLPQFAVPDCHLGKQRLTSRENGTRMRHTLTPTTSTSGRVAVARAERPIARFGPTHLGRCDRRALASPRWLRENGPILGNPTIGVGRRSFVQNLFRYGYFQPGYFSINIGDTRLLLWGVRIQWFDIK